MEHFIWDVDPILISFGSLEIRWYGFLFALNFLIGLKIMEWIYKREKRDPKNLDTLMIYMIIGTAVGARLVHTLFYEPAYYLEHPLEILMIWKPGLASHGALAGILIAIYVYAKRYNESYIWLLSRITIPGALAAGSVRIANLFNSEILGKPSDVPWAIIFKKVDMIPRHPVQIYEALAYFSIFVMLVVVYRKVDRDFATKLLPGLFLITLFCARFMLEFTKTRQAMYSLDIPFSTGQLLSIPFIIVGIIFVILAFKSKTNLKKL